MDNKRIVTLDLSYPYYKFQDIPKFSLLGLKGAPCHIQKWLGTDNSLLVAHYDGKKVLFGDKISFFEDYSVELDDSSLSVIKSFPNYIIFCQHNANNKSIVILDGFDIYLRKYKILDTPLTAKVLYKGAFNRSMLTESCVIRFLDPNIPRYKYVTI